MKPNKIHMNSRKEEFVQLIEKNKRIIHKIAYLYTHSREDNKDLVQEIYLQLWESFDSFKNTAQFSTWLYRVALNTAISQIRRRKKLDIHEADYRAVFHASDPIRNEQSQQLFASISRLNDIDKAIILLWLEEHKYEEIAEILGMSVSNISVKLVRIKTRLKEMIKK